MTGGVASSQKTARHCSLKKKNRQKSRAERREGNPRSRLNKLMRSSAAVRCWKPGSSHGMSMKDESWCGSQTKSKAERRPSSEDISTLPDSRAPWTSSIWLRGPSARVERMNPLLVATSFLFRRRIRRGTNLSTPRPWSARSRWFLSMVALSPATTMTMERRCTPASTPELRATLTGIESWANLWEPSWDIESADNGRVAEWGPWNVMMVHGLIGRTSSPTTTSGMMGTGTTGASLSESARRDWRFSSRRTSSASGPAREPDSRC